MRVAATSSPRPDAVLDPIESPAHSETFAAYVRAIRVNLAALRRALGCR
jgi:hypothetical protein